MLGIFKPPTEILSHWYIPVENFRTSSQEFYAAVENELLEQKVPDLEISRVEFFEGGPLSGKRTYLRLTRERLVFDICAASFGKNFFFSCRFAELNSRVTIFGILLILIILSLLFGFAVRAMGLLNALGVTAIIAIAGTYVLRNLVRLELGALEELLVIIPTIGPIYEHYFRKNSYYAQDTRLMYLTVVDSVVRKLIDRETAANGVKLITEYEHSPFLRELYKPQTRSTQPVSEALSQRVAT